MAESATSTSAAATAIPERPSPAIRRNVSPAGRRVAESTALASPRAAGANRVSTIGASAAVSCFASSAGKARSAISLKYSSEAD
jgi:hypothetical protein